MIELLRTAGASFLWLFVFALFVLAVDRFRGRDAFQFSSVPAGYALFYFFEVALVKLLDLAGFLSTGPMIAVYAAASIAGLAFFAHPDRKIHWYRAADAPDRPTRLIAGIVLASAGLVIGGLSLFSLVVPAHVWDVQAYHLPMVAGYVQSESLVLGASQDLRQIFRVNGAELQMLNLALLSDSDAWMELPNVLALVVSLTAVFLISREVLGRQRAALVTVVATLTAPQILYGTVTAKNDVIFLALILSAFYWTIRIVSEPGARRLPRVSMLALTSSLAVATKVMGLNVVGTVGLVLLVAIVLRKLPFRSVLLYSAVTLVGILALVGDLYWRNLTRAQMPIGIRPGEVHFTIGLENLVEAARFYLYDLSFRRLVTTQIFEHDFSHFGYLFPIMLVMGTVATVRQIVVKRERRIGVGILSLITVIFFLSVIALREPIQWDQRFMIWMVPAFTILAVFLLRHWDTHALLALAAFCSAIALFHVAQIFTNASGGIFQRSATHLVENGRLARLTDVRHERYAHKIDGFEVLAEAAAPGDSILYVGAEDTWMYPAWGREFSRSVVGVRDSVDVVQKLRTDAFSFVVVEADAAEPLQRAALQTGTSSGYAPLYSSENRSIFRRQRFSGAGSTR